MGVFFYLRATPLIVSLTISLSLAGQKLLYAVQWDLLEIGRFGSSMQGKHQSGSWDSGADEPPPPITDSPCDGSNPQAWLLLLNPLQGVKIQDVASRGPASGASCMGFWPFPRRWLLGGACPPQEAWPLWFEGIWLIAGLPDVAFPTSTPRVFQ